MRNVSAILAKASLAFSSGFNVDRKSLMIFSVSVTFIGERAVAEGVADATLVVGVSGTVANVDC